MKKHLLFILLAITALTSCDKIVGKFASSASKEVTEVVAEKTAKEMAEATLERGARELSEEFLETAAEKSLKEMLTSNSVYKRLYDDFISRISKDFADGITVKSSKLGVELLSKKFPTSAIRIQGNTIYGKAGSLIDEGPVNQFLNVILPNKTYVIDDVFVYQTDELGRVISCQADRSKAFSKLAGKRNPQRNSDVQRLIVEKLDGNVGLDDGGHLFANTTGGPNELINQVPMAKSLNRNGQWRKLERVEEDALKQGKKVISQRRLLYKGSEKRPYAIEFITKIDNQETKTIVQNID